MKKTLAKIIEKINDLPVAKAEFRKIAKDPERAYEYARDVIGGRWSEAEKYIAKNPNCAIDYAKDVIGGRWPEAEKYIAKDPWNAYLYAEDVLKRPWPEAGYKL